MPYAPYDPARPQPSTAIGWDAWADDYARLGVDNAVYALGKRLLHRIVEQVAPRPSDRERWALDFNCGAGDDVERLCRRGWRVAGCDGSPGMLRAAAVRSGRELRDGRVELWHGRAEELATTSFGGRRFDLIFSTTGGFTYLDDAAFVETHRTLAEMLDSDGVMVLAHLTPFCLAESAYHLARLSPRAAAKRWSPQVAIDVRGQSLTMHLRSARKIRHLLAGTVRIERMVPLLVCTPPFQSGFRPGRRLSAFLEAVERTAGRFHELAAIADQVVCVARRL